MDVVNKICVDICPCLSYHVVLITSFFYYSGNSQWLVSHQLEAKVYLVTEVAIPGSSGISGNRKV